MIELKTLKELKTYIACHSMKTDDAFLGEADWEDEGDRAIIPEQVKQELGIKWIKAFQKGECHTDFAADGRNGQENIIEWIQHVFNISDEDLT